MAWNLIGNSNTDEATNFVGTTDPHALVFRTNRKEAARIDLNGNVGIGTANPSARLEVTGQVKIDNQDAVLVEGFQPFVTLTDTENSGAVRTRIQNAGGTLNFFTEAFFAAGVPPMRILANGTVQMSTQDALQINGFQPFVTLTDTENSGAVRTRIQNAGGTLNFFTEAFFATGVPPLRILANGTVQMFTQDALQIIGFQPFITLIDSEPGTGGRARIQNARGDLNFFTEKSLATGVPPMKINNATGNVEVNTDIVLTGADCAEDFDVIALEDIEAGSVLVIDSGGRLAPCRQQYDKKVAGVVSGAGDFRPGLVLDRQSAMPSRKSVALIGKVYCKVDAQFGSIEIGDLLTTSETPGHAMKAIDAQRAFGSVIGKALRPLRTGVGCIPMLVSLQ